MLPAAWGAARYRVLHNFGAGKDGTGVPSGPLLLHGNGNLYGNTYSVAFELAPQANGNWKEIILHTFAVGDGTPWGALISDPTGNLYGTTVGGPISNSEVFELSPGTQGWSFSTLYTDGAGPGLLMDNAGNLYGDMGPGQYKYYGAIAELSPGSDGWTYTALYSFCDQQDCPDGWDPWAPPIWDGKGNLFGTTYRGGIGQPACWTSFGCGVIFKMTPNKDGTWTYHVLHRFASYPTDGQSPAAGLVMDAAGNFYGNTALGGVHNNGTVFKLAFIAGRWKKTVLYDFPDYAEGTNPGYAMGFDKAGNLYGVAASGGLADCGGYTCGVVFKLTPQKNGKWKYSVLHKFAGADGGFPLGVILDDKGNLYGTTQAFGKYGAGVAFEITP